MATLMREEASLSQLEMTEDVESDLNNNIPAPFPKDLVQQLIDESTAQGHDTEANMQDASTQTAHTITRPTLCIPQIDTTPNQEVGPSMMHVQQSCLMTLNNLLSQDSQTWQPIVPTRRHSLPAHSPISPTANFQSLLTTPTSSSALQILVSNLRYRDDPEMRQIATDDDASLLTELNSRVNALVDDGLLEPRDAHLAKSLVSLLTHLNRLSIIDPDSSYRAPVDSPQPPSAADIYDTLSWQVSALQSHRDAHMSLGAGSSSTQAPVQVVESALLWNQIDDDLDEVFRLCRERTDLIPRSLGLSTHSLPPEYGDELSSSTDELPSYHAEYYETTAAITKHKSQESTSQSVLPHSQHNIDEKMRLDLEAVTMAIDRLYLVAPQLSNQRVELKRSKLEQMERARINGSNSSSRSMSTGRKEKGKEIMANTRERGAFSTGGKIKQQDLQELDSMLSLINKASSRRIEGQSVVLNGKDGMAERFEKARLRDLAKRDEFHERLVTHSNARRLTSQDAVPSTPPPMTSPATKTKNPDALLTLPEFIREAIPDNVEQARDPEALLTLPEFVREPPQSPSFHETAFAVASSASKFMKKPFKPSRRRSLSAPPLALAWLITGSTSIGRRSSTLIEPKAEGNDQNKGHVNGQTTPNRAGLDVQYVAEHQENLHSVSVFLQVGGQQMGVDIEAEVVPSGGERLIIKCGASTSAPLCLPARVLPGKKDVKVQSGHLEVKLDCSSQENTQSSQYSDDTPGTGLLDATQLKALSPTSFICASCSLPIVQSSRLSRYDDLPSEHWAELLEAWMCHSDQKLNGRIIQYADDLVPAPGQALVGGSYVLFDSSSVMSLNIRPGDPSTVQGPHDWRPVRCICGAVTGRCRQYTSPSTTESTTYRLAKYAIRPVSPISDPLKIPLSAFILEDMDELVHAHATYRFIVLDEEDEKPRVLLWMFKPHIRISYATSTHHLIARSASIQAAKVHYKILGPSVSPTFKSTTEKYPGFAQSERLVYPLDICRSLAGLLKESNLAYPQGRRVMAGLDVGWLLRV